MHSEVALAVSCADDLSETKSGAPILKLVTSSRMYPSSSNNVWIFFAIFSISLSQVVEPFKPYALQ